MEIALTNNDGEAGPSLEVSEAAFGVPYNETLVHQIVTAYMAAGRVGTKANRSRADVRGGGAKPWRQKGTGRARSGTSRSPIWRGGGVTFAARPRNFAQKVNRKMYRAALRTIFSELVRSQRLMVLVITEGHDEKLSLSVRNLHWAAVIDAGQLNPVSLLAYEQVLVTSAALKLIEVRLTGAKA